MQDAYEVKATQPEVIRHFVKFVGGTAAVTKVHGPGVTVTFVNTGLVDLTWAESPGDFMGVTVGFQATTAANVAGWTAAIGGYNATTRTIRVTITKADNTVENLNATSWLNLDIVFRNTAV